MVKSLIVYFSHDKQNYISGVIKELEIGNTKVVAKKIQEIINADIFEIKPLHDYPYDYHDCTKIANEELALNKRPKLLNIVSHMEDYERIYLGFPNWWGTMPMCVWSFLEMYDLKDMVIYPFCTHEGSKMGHSLHDIARLCPQSDIKQYLEIKGSEVNVSDNKIKEWLKEG